MRVHVLCSGGLDSTTLVYHYRAIGYEVVLHWFDFGQPSASIEWRTVKEFANRLECLSSMHKLASVRFRPGEVPGRNEALVMECIPHVERPALLALGIHAGCEYEDTKPSFKARLQGLLDLRYDGRLRLDCPFIDLTKRDIVAYARRLGVDVANTYSCDAGTLGHCGQCRSCHEREAVLDETDSPLIS